MTLPILMRVTEWIKFTTYNKLMQRNNYAHIINPGFPQFIKYLNAWAANRDFIWPGQACKRSCEPYMHSNKNSSLSCIYSDKSS